VSSRSFDSGGDVGGLPPEFGADQLCSESVNQLNQSPAQTRGQRHIQAEGSVLIRKISGLGDVLLL